LIAPASGIAAMLLSEDPASLTVGQTRPNLDAYKSDPRRSSLHIGSRWTALRDIPQRRKNLRCVSFGRLWDRASPESGHAPFHCSILVHLPPYFLSSNVR
jgi:hypothetical protein